MFIVETLPRAGTPLLYRFGNGKWHKAIIDSGMVFTHCGISGKDTPYPHVDPNRDDFSVILRFDHVGNKDKFCQRCAR